MEDNLGRGEIIAASKVMDRMKKFEHAEQSLAAIRTYEEKYLKK
jgi:hypothetical protein